MSFVFTEDYEFDWPVRVSYPGQSGQEERSFVARFRLPPEDEIARIFFAPPQEEWSQRGYDATIATEWAKVESVLIGWSGVQLEGGKDFPFSPENLVRLLNQRPVRIALSRAAWAAIIEGGSRAKN